MTVVLDYLTEYLFESASALSPDIADKYTIDLSPHDIKINVFSIYIPRLEVEIGYDPRASSFQKSSALIFNTYLTSQIYNLFCAYYSEHKTTSGASGTGMAADDLVRLNLKKSVAERLVAVHGSRLGYALLFEYLCVGEPRMRAVFGHLDSSPELRAARKFFQCLASDFILYHEVGHAIYRYPDGKIIELREIATEMLEPLRQKGTDPRFLDAEEVFCDLLALRFCGVRFAHNMPLESLVPILDVLVKFFAVVVTAAGQADSLLAEEAAVEKVRPWVDAKEFIWPRAQIALYYTRSKDFAAYVDEHQHIPKLPRVPIAVELPPFSLESMSWVVNNVTNCSDPGVRTAAHIASEAIARGVDGAKSYMLDVCSKRAHEDGRIDETDATPTPSADQASNDDTGADAILTVHPTGDHGIRVRKSNGLRAEKPNFDL